jgi:hypothetical protein
MRNLALAFFGKRKNVRSIRAEKSPFHRRKNSINLPRNRRFLERSGVKWPTNSRHLPRTADGQMRPEMGAESGFQSPKVSR